MLAVKVIKSFKRRGEIIPPGTIINIPDDILPKLAGLVELPRPDRQPVVSIPDDETRLADEAERRADFCNIHRQMIGGTCPRFNMIEGLGGFIENNNSTSPGDQAKALDACLLWRLIRCGEKIEKAAQAEIVGAVTVGDVLVWVSVNAKDVETLRNDRRLLLTCAESLQGAGHFWETIH